MLKKIIIYSLLVLVTGCEQNDLNLSLKNDTKTDVSFPFKWAEIDESKVQTKINQSFAQSHPYPKEINEDDNSLRNRYNLIEGEINEINKDNVKKCIAVAAENVDGKQPVNIHTRYYDNDDYIECLKNARADAFLVNLEEKITEIKQIRTKRTEYARIIRKQETDAIELGISKYAEKNGYQLIVKKKFSVVYNQDKIVLEVTDDVIDYILKNNKK